MALCIHDKTKLKHHRNPNFKGSVREYLEFIYVPEDRKDEKTWYRKIVFK